MHFTNFWENRITDVYTHVRACPVFIWYALCLCTLSFDKFRTLWLALLVCSASAVTAPRFFLQFSPSGTTIHEVWIIFLIRSLHTNRELPLWLSILCFIAEGLIANTMASLKRKQKQHHFGQNLMTFECVMTHKNTVWETPFVLAAASKWPWGSPFSIRIS